MSGGALAISGACLQGMFKNPMADSYVIGVSAGAALGATIALAFSSTLAFLGFGAVSLFAFIGALAAVMVVYRLASTNGKVTTFSLLLSGIAVSTLSTALVYCFMIMFRDKMEHIDVDDGQLYVGVVDKVFIAVPVMLIASALCLCFARALNIMLQGDESARHLGRGRGPRAAQPDCADHVAAASAVSVSGIIGFVGLIVPHMLRFDRAGPSRAARLFSAAACSC